MVKRLGILLPSSNTVVETEGPKLIPKDESVTLHFARLRVTLISDVDESEKQFELPLMLEAAALLRDAGVDAIAWAGTAASWLGFERDDALIEAIRIASGMPATTALISVNGELEAHGVKRLALVTPYTAAIEKRIIRNYAAIGVVTVAAERLDLTTNIEIAAVTAAQIAIMCRATAKARPDAIVIMCTNLCAGSIVNEVAWELGIPIIDSVAATMRGGLRSLAEARDLRTPFQLQQYPGAVP
jgi:maleate isomerase